MVRTFDLGEILSQENVKSDFGRSCDWMAARRSSPLSACVSHRMRQSVSATSPLMRESFGAASSTSFAPTM